jgi:hypothetical protein
MYLTTLFVVALFALTQFSKPILYNMALVAYQVLLIRIFGAPAQWLAAHTGFNTYDAFFWAKFVYTLIMAGTMAIALWFYAQNKREFRLCLILAGSALGSVVVANIASKVLRSHWLETFSRDMLEVLTSPFPVLFLIPVVILYRNTSQSPK